MINYIKNGDSFYQNDGSGIIKIFKEITKDEYNRLANMTYKEREDEITEPLGQEVFCGYGFYGCGVLEIGNKYYTYYKRGSTCD